MGEPLYAKVPTPQAVRQTGQRGAQHEGEGQDEAEGPHLTVSGFSCRRCPPFGVGLITSAVSGSLRRSRKWFHRAENCFVAGRDEAISGKRSMIQAI